VPKSAILDFEALRERIGVASRATDSLWWWMPSGDKIVFCFDETFVAMQLTIWFKNQGIPFETELRQRK
jgi:hypothetical protein